MSKTSITLLIILSLVLGIFVFQYFSPGNTFFPALSKSIRQPGTTTSFSETTLSLSPRPLTGQVATIEVHIATKGNMPADQPNLIQLELAYDPLTVTPLQITPGDYFTKPNILLHTIRSGRISYAIACQTQAMACINAHANQVALITFTVHPTIVKKDTTVTLLPKSLVKTKSDHKITVHLNSTKITLPYTKIPVASGAGVIK